MIYFVQPYARHVVRVRITRYDEPISHPGNRVILPIPLQPHKGVPVGCRLQLRHLDMNRIANRERLIVEGPLCGHLNIEILTRRSDIDPQTSYLRGTQLVDPIRMGQEVPIRVQQFRSLRDPTEGDGGIGCDQGIYYYIEWYDLSPALGPLSASGKADAARSGVHEGFRRGIYIDRIVGSARFQPLAIFCVEIVYHRQIDITEKARGHVQIDITRRQCCGVHHLKIGAVGTELWGLDQTT